jgi:hypothetical protein
MADTDNRRVVTGNLEVLLADVQDLILDGWVISDDERGELSVFGNSCQVTMVRDESTVQQFKARAESIQGRPKLTVQDRMAKARAARGIEKGAKLDVGTVRQK